MREIVHLQAGQCGNQIGSKVSKRRPNKLNKMASFFWLFFLFFLSVLRRHEASFPFCMFVFGVLEVGHRSSRYRR